MIRSATRSVSSADSSTDHPRPMAPASALPSSFFFFPLVFFFLDPRTPGSPIPAPPIPAAIANASRSSSTDAGGASTPAARPSSKSLSRRLVVSSPPPAFRDANPSPSPPPPSRRSPNLLCVCAAKSSMYRSSPYTSRSSQTRGGFDPEASPSKRAGGKEPEPSLSPPSPSRPSDDTLAASSPSRSARRSPSTVRTHPAWSGSRVRPVTSEAPGGNLRSVVPPRVRWTERDAASTAVTAAATAAANPSHAAPLPEDLPEEPESQATQHATVAALAPSQTSSVGKKK
mmetsp:Transcript_7475/g.33730  ORF Transcript_7475/g.33730 Transcript_7475/m.33730 type:complete len:286 (+) Transcript_7475:5553-6410(+)